MSTLKNIYVEKDRRGYAVRLTEENKNTVLHELQEIQMNIFPSFTTDSSHRPIIIIPEAHTFSNPCVVNIGNWILYDYIEKSFHCYSDVDFNKRFKKLEETIRIKYFTDKIDKLEYIGGKSDWIDLRCAEEIEMKAGEFKLIPLGIAMELPEGYEAHVVPRSSTFKNYGVIQTNSMGVIDETYCGDNDQWFFPAYALRDTVIHINDRICQFRIMKHQPALNLDAVDILDNEDRGGHGSTGKQ